MKISNAARLIFWVAAIFAIGFLVRAESGDRRTSMPRAKSAPSIRIVDQNGQPAVNGVQSPNGTIVDVAVGKEWFYVCASHRQHLGGRHGAVDLGRERTQCHQRRFLLVPRLAILFPEQHELLPGNDFQPNAVYEFTFTQPGTFAYHCCVHCAFGMTGVVNVSGGVAPSGWSAVPICQAPAAVSASACIFQPTGSFTRWGDAMWWSEFVHPFEYDPVGNSWTTKSASYPDATVSNIVRCG